MLLMMMMMSRRLSSLIRWRMRMINACWGWV
jgi:hypothetical protein